MKLSAVPCGQALRTSFNESAQELVLQSDEAIATPNASALVLSLAFPFASARACEQQQRATCTRGTCPRRRRRVRVPSQRSKAGVALSRAYLELRAPRQALHASSMPQCLDQPATAAEVAIESHPPSLSTLEEHGSIRRSTGTPPPPPPPLPLLLPLLLPLPAPTPCAMSSGARPTTSLCSTTASPSSQRSE